MNRFIKRGNAMKFDTEKLKAGIVNFFSDKKRRTRFIWISAVVLVLVILIVAAAIYLGDYYRADLDALSSFEPLATASVERWDDGTLVFKPDTPVAGLIFYPGGKVEYSAYSSLMAACSEWGILCVLIEMPFNLAVLDVNAADGIAEKFPEIDSWYIGGHSLGGSMAADYLSRNSDKLDGLILLGSYSTADLCLCGVPVLSIYGSEDGVMNREKYSRYKTNLPQSFTEIIINGGNHSGFASYGLQEGDGTSLIDPMGQIILTAGYIAEFITLNE